MEPIHKGWHSRGYLPHFDSTETIQFVTFRLADSLPAFVAETLAETDQRLDAGHGACWLRYPAVATLTQDVLLHIDGACYRLLAWCIMPNHVHAVMEVAHGHQLGAIVRSWKSFTAMQANRIVGRAGPFWHRDYFDRFIRDEGHLHRTIDYVENNPVKVGLASDPAGWPWSSAHERAGGSRSRRL